MSAATTAPLYAREQPAGPIEPDNPGRGLGGQSDLRRNRAREVAVAPTHLSATCAMLRVPDEARSIRQARHTSAGGRRDAVELPAQLAIEYLKPLWPACGFAQLLAHRRCSRAEQVGATTRRCRRARPAGRPNSARAPSGLSCSWIPDCAPSCSMTAGAVCRPPTSVSYAPGGWAGSTLPRDAERFIQREDHREKR